MPLEQYIFFVHISPIENIYIQINTKKEQQIKDVVPETQTKTHSKIRIKKPIGENSKFRKSDQYQN